MITLQEKIAAAHRLQKEVFALMAGEYLNLSASLQTGQTSVHLYVRVMGEQSRTAWTKREIEVDINEIEAKEVALQIQKEIADKYKSMPLTTNA